MTNTDSLIVALDFPTGAEALALVDQISPPASFFKVGLELFTVVGPSMIVGIKDRGHKVFLDLKLHDIPNTVAGAAAACTRLGVDLLTVHAAGGREMLQAAREAVAEEAARLGRRAPLVVAITLLTSIDQEILHNEMGIPGDLTDQVLRRAALAQEAGLDGVVASPLEVAALRAQCGPDFQLVIPGVRPLGAAKGDQKRVTTPGEARAAGANYLVVGRPITRAAEPLAVVKQILQELEGVADAK